MSTKTKTPDNPSHRAVRTARAPQVTVAVTTDLIEDAARRDSGHCMIAEAVKLAVPGARRVSVDLQTIRFTDPTRDLRFTYLTPRVGQVALVDFDQGDRPEPFGFRLRGGAVSKAGSNPAVKAKRASEARSRTRAHTDIAEAASGKEPKTGVGTTARLVQRRSGKEPGSESALERIGGPTPPLAALASPAPITGRRKGQRREFGLRSFQR